MGLLFCFDLRFWVGVGMWCFVGRWVACLFWICDIMLSLVLWVGVLILYCFEHLLHCVGLMDFGVCVCRVGVL